MTDRTLTREEKAAIQALRRLARKWPQSLIIGSDSIPNLTIMIEVDGEPRWVDCIEGFRVYDW